MKGLGLQTLLGCIIMQIKLSYLHSDEVKLALPVFSCMK